MLVEIYCKSFAGNHQRITFHAGLNTVLGSNVGSNAIGKSTFLWIINYAFGGEAYNTICKDNQQYIGGDPVYFTFRFGDQYSYFSRSFEEPRNVCCCDKSGHLIKKITLDEYRKWLCESYHCNSSFPFQSYTDRFHRIYGAENIYEKIPYLVKPKESDDKAADFLLCLSGNSEIIQSVSQAEQRLGVKFTEFTETKIKTINTSKINENNKKIASMQERLDRLNSQVREDELAFFGFSTESYEKLLSLRKEIRNLAEQRNKIKTELNAVSGVKPFAAANLEGEFVELGNFFPDANIKSFSEIETFHEKLHNILEAEANTEKTRLSDLLAQIDKELETLKRKVEESGLPGEMSARTVSQCVSLSKNIDCLTAENEELIHQKELQDARLAAESEIKQIIERLQSVISSVETDINKKLTIANYAVTEGQELPPKIRIFDDKMIKFGTAGNTSEGTAFKSMVVYDIALSSLYSVPTLIHDSNILKRIDDTYFEHILECYQSLGIQVFIAFDKADSATDKAKRMLNETLILSLDDGNELYGKSWSKKTKETK